MPEGALWIAHFENGGGFGGAITSFEEHVRYAPPECKHLIATSHTDAATMHVLHRSGARVIELPQYRRPDLLLAAFRRMAGLSLITKLFAVSVGFAEVLARTVYGAMAAYKLRSYRIAAVHLNNGLFFNLEGVVASKLLGVPCLLTVRGLETRTDPIVRTVAPLLASAVTHVLAVSSYIADQLIAWGVPPARVTTVFETVDIELCRQKMEEPLPELDAIPSVGPVIAMVGCILPWKGYGTFVEAAALVLRGGRVPDASFWVIGGPAKGTEDFALELRRRAAALGLEERLRFFGHQNNVFPWTGRSDAVVHASLQPEPFGRVIIEAMALGKPVIASRLGGPVEIISDGETGLLIEPGNPEILARAIEKLLTDNELRQRLIEGGTRTVSHKFSTAAFSGKIRSVYEQALPALAASVPSNSCA